MKLFSYIGLNLALFVCFGSTTVSAQQLSISGTLKLAPGSKIGIFGDLSNNGTLIDSSTAFILAGDNPQTIEGDSISELINLTINNQSVEGVTLSQHLLVAGSLTLSDGKIQTSKTALLTLQDGAVVVGGDTSSYVEGPINKIGNSAFTFPTGKQGLYAPLSIGAPDDKTDQFTCEYFNEDPNEIYDASSRDADIEQISSCEYWLLDRTVGSSEVEVTLSWGGRGCSNVVPSKARVIKWSGRKWLNYGNGGSTGTDSNGTVVSNESISSFSPFAIGSSSTALPISLLSITNHCSDRVHTVEWATASETDNDYFTIETSFDGTSWSAISEVTGQGNSSTETAYHYRIPKGVNTGDYLRLKQTDFNGEYTVSSPISSSPCIEKGLRLNAYPNPTRDILNIQLSTGINEKINYTFYNSTGMVVRQGILKDGTINLFGIPQGTYLCRFETPMMTFVKKVSIVD